MSTAALEGAVWFLALWFVWSFVYQPVLLNRLRQRLFSIRDRLFDFAAAGAISFTSPEYTLLRGVVNSSIRYAHRFRLLNVLAHARAHRRFPNESADVISVRDRWLQAVEQNADETVSKKLRYYEDNVRRNITEYVVLSSGPMLGLLAVFSVVHVVQHLYERGIQYCSTLLEDFRREPEIISIGSIISHTVTPRTPQIDSGVDVLLDEAFLDARISASSRTPGARNSDLTPVGA